MRRAEQMVFTPWNTLEAHRPLGSLTRGRLSVYRASSDYRRAMNAQLASHQRRVRARPSRAPRVMRGWWMGRTLSARTEKRSRDRDWHILERSARARRRGALPASPSACV
jgi:hypothetical protein